MAPIIVVSNLTKNYGRTRGVTDLTFEVNEGEIFGFLGPNGAGKTTMIRVLLGLLRPTSGSARVAGFDCWRQPVEVHRLTGYLPGEFALDPALTGAQILQYLANLRGDVDQRYLDALVERLALDTSRRFREYSHGNKQKIGLIQAFMHRPRLLILDEPTSGLDPLNQQEFFTMAAEARAEGRTIFLSSHILSEVEHTCDRVAIIREGALVKVDAVASLKELEQHTMEVSFAAPASPEWFAHLHGVRSATAEHGGMTLRLDMQGDLPEVIQVAAQRGAVNIATHEPSLEEVFLRYYAPTRPAAAEAPSPPEALATR